MTRELHDRGMAAPHTVRTLARSLLQYSWRHAEKKASGGTEHPSTHHVDALRYRQIGARWSTGAASLPPGLGGVTMPGAAMVGVR